MDKLNLLIKSLTTEPNSEDVLMEVITSCHKRREKKKQHYLPTEKTTK